MSSVKIRNLIRQKFDSLSSKEKLVAQYVLDNYQQSMLLSSSELAEMAGVSDTTVVRFAKSLGFSGFLQYRNTIKKEYVPTQKVYASLAVLEEERTSSSSLLDWYTGALLSDISGFVKNMPVDKINQMAHEVLNCDKLYLFGIGSDSTVVQFLNNYLPLLGIQCVLVTEEGLALKEKLFLMSNNDCMLMSAYPTLGPDDYWAAAYAKQKNAKVILLSDSDITARRLQADISVSIEDGPETFFNSYVIQMIFCNALLLQIYELDKESCTKSMKAYQDMLSER
ncbi:MAG: MurR/RpiR family transcriptional regulator [Anaerovoracaceae bacterium]